jgi:hypothetical protein
VQTLTTSPIFDNLTAGRVPFASATKTLTDSENLTYDGTTITLSGTSFPVLDLRRTTTATNTVNSSFRLTTISTGDMVDGLGGRMLFAIRDNAGVDNLIGGVGAIRDGADNAGVIDFAPYLAGVATTRFRVWSDGKLSFSTTKTNEYIDGVSSTGNILFSARAGVRVLADNNNNDAGTATQFGVYTGSSEDGIFLVRKDGQVNIKSAFPPQLQVYSSDSDETNQYSSLTSKAYLNADGNWCPFFGYASSGSNSARFGGGTSLANAATELRFYTAANTSTTTGSVRMVIGSSGNVAIGGITTSDLARLSVVNSTATTIAQVIRGATSQSANLTEWQNSSGTVLGSVDKDGRITVATDVTTSSGAGVGSRLDGFRNWTEHFKTIPSSGWSWVADAAGDYMAGAPTTVDILYGSVLRFGGASNTNAFYCRSSAVGSIINAKLMPYAFASCIAGVRVDDSSDPANHYVELYLEYVSGQGWDLKGRYNDGLGETVVTALSYQPVGIFNHLAININDQGGGLWRALTSFSGGEIPAGFLVTLGSSKAWTPDRAGMFLRSGTTADRYCYVDAVS